MLRPIKIIAFLLIVIGLSIGCAAEDAEEQQTESPTEEIEQLPAEATESPTEPAQVEEPTSLRVAIPVLPANLDPNDDSSLVHFKVWKLIYGTLVEVDAEGNAQPALATSWEIVEPTAWEFALREGVTFHNGEPFNAEVVRTTINHILDPDTNSAWAQRLSAIEEVEVVDTYTVRIVTEEPFPLLAKNLATAFMLPPEYLNEIGADEFGLAPVGTGPFTFEEFEADRFVRLQKFVDHWRGEPNVDNMELRQIPEASSRIAALEAEEIDLVYGVPPEQVERLEGDGFQVTSAPVGASWLAFFYTNEEPLDDRRVRQALNYATDAESIHESLFFDLSRVLEGQMVGPNATGYNPDVEPYPYDPERARELLAEAGYSDGVTIRFESPSGRYFRDTELAETLCSQWSQVGVTCDLALLESNVWVGELLDGTLGPISIAPWQTAPQLDLQVPMTNFVDQSPRNIASIPRVNELYAQAQTTIDPDERLEVLHELAQVVHDEALSVFLFENVNVYGLSPNVQNASFRPDHSFDPMDINVTE